MNFPDGTGISLPAERKACEDHLCKEFPHQAEAIGKYFEVVYGFCDQSAEFAAKSAASTGEPGAVKKAIMKVGFPKLYPLLAKYAMKSTQEVLDEFFTDPKLQLALSAIPARSSLTEVARPPKLAMPTTASEMPNAPRKAMTPT